MSRILAILTLLGLLTPVPTWAAAPQEGTWYGMYVAGQRSGYLHIHSAIEADGAQVSRQATVLLITTDGGPQRSETVLTERSLPTVGLVEKHTIQRSQSLRPAPEFWGFRAPPRAPIVNEVRQVRQPDGGFEETIREGDHTRTRKLPTQAGGNAASAWSEEGWVRGWPALGDRLPGTTRMVTAVDYDPANGLLQYEITALIEGRPTEVNRYDAAGQLLYSRHGMFELRLEPAEQAQDIKLSANLNELTDARLDQPLDNPNLLTHLVLETTGGEGLLADGPNQRVSRDAATGRCTLELGPNDTAWPLKPADRDRYLADTADYPVRHPRVVALAHEGIGQAVTEEEMVRALVHFVRGYLEYERDARDPSVLEVMESRRGDCSEYARLMVTLARAVGIPARKVSGLAHASGDQFGMHAWVEVAVKEHWVAVDPTAGSHRLNPGYIRFDPDAVALPGPGLRLRLLSADRLPLRLVDPPSFWDDFRPYFWRVVLWAIWFLFIWANVTIARQKGRSQLACLLLSIPLAPMVSLFLIAARPAAAAPSDPTPLPVEANDACGFASPAPSSDSR